jgi:hypothetical protein
MKNFLLALNGEYAPSVLVLLSVDAQSKEKVIELQSLITEHKLSTITLNSFNHNFSFRLIENNLDEKDNTEDIIQALESNEAVEVSEEFMDNLTDSDNPERLRDLNISITEDTITMNFYPKNGSEIFETSEISTSEL